MFRSGEFFEFELGDFAGGDAGEFVEDADFAGDFVFGESFAAVGEDFFGVERGAAGGGADEGDGEFAFGGDVAADDGGFVDAGEGVEDLFDFAGVDVHAVDEEHFFFAVHDEDVAVAVFFAHVAGVEPAVAEGEGVFVVLVPVAAHDVGAADDDLADGVGGEFVVVVVEDSDFDVGDGQSGGAGFADTVERVEGDDGGGFAESVAFEEWESEFFVEFDECFAGQGSGAGDGDAEVEEPVDVEGDVRVDHGLEELGDADEDGGAGTDDFFDGVVKWLDGFDEDNAAANGKRRENADGQHETVKHRKEKGDAVALGFVEDADATADVGGEVGVGEHGALGFAGGAGGVDDDGKVVEGWLGEFGRCGCGRLREVGDVEEADMLKFIGDIPEFFAGDQPGKLAVVGYVLNFRCLEEGVDGDSNGAGLEDGEECVDEFRTVFDEETNAVAFAEGEAGLKVRGEPRDARRDFTVADAFVAPVDRDALGASPRCGVELCEDGLHNHQSADCFSAIIVAPRHSVTRHAETFPPLRKSLPATSKTCERRAVGTYERAKIFSGRRTWRYSNLTREMSAPVQTT